MIFDDEPGSIFHLPDKMVLRFSFKKLIFVLNLNLSLDGYTQSLKNEVVCNLPQLFSMHSANLY